jgi:antitoxin CcdA
MRIYDAHDWGRTMQANAEPRKRTNLTLDPSLLTEARSYGVNLSQAAEAGVRRAVSAAKAEAWKRENAAALASSNTWADAQGLPLDQYRQF